MSAWFAQTLPHFGAALVLACILLTITRRLGGGLLVRRLCFAAVLIAALIPLPEYSLSHYLRVLTGDLSITSLLWFSLAAYFAIINNEVRHTGEQLGAAAVIVATALLLYPTALGLTYFDLYAFGYYPIILGPCAFALFAWCFWFGFTFPALLIAAGFTGYALGLLESDNLWDYLLDPVILVYSIFLLVTNRRRLRDWRPGQRHIEVLLGVTAATFLMFAIYLSRFDTDAFRHEFVVEDGFTEGSTAIVLVCTMLVCARRLLVLWRRRSGVFLGMTALLTLLCLFGAGEEISWGQRIFDLETPDYFKERNAQGELGLHNLVVEIGGERIKLNRLIFGAGLAVGLFVYLFVLTPLYRIRPRVRAFCNALAAPMPRNYQIAGYLLTVATVELLIDSSKRGEMTEFAGVIVFALNVIYPANPEIFDPKSAV